MNKPLFKNLQNIDRNKTVKYGLSAAEVEKKLRKWPLKICIVIGICCIATVTCPA